MDSNQILCRSHLIENFNFNYVYCVYYFMIYLNLIFGHCLDKLSRQTDHLKFSDVFINKWSLLIHWYRVIYKNRNNKRKPIQDQSNVLILKRFDFWISYKSFFVWIRIFCIWCWINIAWSSFSYFCPESLTCRCFVTFAIY